jgi:hypothetical protein
VPCVHGTRLASKIRSKVLKFEKNVIKPKSKGSSFGRWWLKPIPEEPSHKF